MTDIILVVIAAACFMTLGVRHLTTGQTKSIKWVTEHTFWFEKHHRAFLRAQIAITNHDIPSAEKAIDQMKEFSARMESTVPEEVRREWTIKQEQELHEALIEK